MSVRQDFSWRHSATEYHQLYEALLAARSAPNL
jgi:glycogen synthase